MGVFSQWLQRRQSSVGSVGEGGEKVLEGEEEDEGLEVVSVTKRRRRGSLPVGGGKKRAAGRVKVKIQSCNLCRSAN